MELKKIESITDIQEGDTLIITGDMYLEGKSWVKEVVKLV